MADSDRPSKTQRKREVLALQALGESLIALPDAELVSIPVPDKLLEAVRDARRMTKRGALHRQKQYIGRVMREFDAAPIAQYMSKRAARGRADTGRFHKLERWRDRLIDEGDSALADLLEDFPQADRQHLRRLMRDSAAERTRDTAPRAARQLFRYLDKLME